jgi:hypothetical protein
MSGSVLLLVRRRRKRRRISGWQERQRDLAPNFAIDT